MIQLDLSLEFLPNDRGEIKRQTDQFLAEYFDLKIQHMSSAMKLQATQEALKIANHSDAARDMAVQLFSPGSLQEFKVKVLAYNELGRRIIDEAVRRVIKDNEVPRARPEQHAARA